MLAAYRESEAKTAAPAAEDDHDAKLSKWAGEFKPPQVLAVAGNAATYSIRRPGRLGEHGMGRR